MGSSEDPVLGRPAVSASSRFASIQFTLDCLCLFLSWILAWRWIFGSSRLCRLKQKPHYFPCKKVPVNLISEKLRLKFNQDLV